MAVADPPAGIVRVEFDLHGLLGRHQHGVLAGLRNVGVSLLVTWNVWPCRWNGWNIIDSLMKRIRTRWFGLTGTPSFGGLYSMPLTGQVYPLTGPVRRASIT